MILPKNVLAVPLLAKAFAYEPSSEIACVQSLSASSYLLNKIKLLTGKHVPYRKRNTGTGEMTQWIKVLVARPEDLDPYPHGEGKNQLSQVVL